MERCAGWADELFSVVDERVGPSSLNSLDRGPKEITEHMHYLASQGIDQMKGVVGGAHQKAAVGRICRVRQATGCRTLVQVHKGIPRNRGCGHGAWEGQKRRNRLRGVTLDVAAGCGV